MKESILISIIVIFIYIFYFTNRKDMIMVETLNGNSYMVYKDTFQQEKGELLDEILNNLYKLKNHLVNNIHKYPEYADYIKQLDKNFNKNRTNIVETDPKSSYTSYSVNKGEELSFCLKSKKEEKLHDINILMYVSIHEISHIACPEIGHGELFRKIFKKFLEVAIDINIYKNHSYSKNPVEYCGMIVGSSINE